MFCLRGWLFSRRNGIHCRNHCSSRRGLCAFDSSPFEQLSNRFQRCLFEFVYHPPGEGRVQFDRFCLVTSGFVSKSGNPRQKQKKQEWFLPNKVPNTNRAIRLPRAVLCRQGKGKGGGAGKGGAAGGGGGGGASGAGVATWAG